MGPIPAGRNSTDVTCKACGRKTIHSGQGVAWCSSCRHKAPEATEKPWGKTRRIYLDHGVEIWHASIDKGGFSSRHHHRSKVNDFYVVSGELAVLTYEGDMARVKACHTLKAGDKLSLGPGEWHRFQALTDVELIEIYWLLDIDAEDIVRSDTGGKRCA